MFGIGMPELAVIAVVALVLLGPRRLPEVARALGKGLAEFRKVTGDVNRELEAARGMIEAEAREHERERRAREKERARQEQLDKDAAPGNAAVAGAAAAGAATAAAATTATDAALQSGPAHASEPPAGTIATADPSAAAGAGTSPAPPAPKAPTG